MEAGEKGKAEKKGGGSEGKGKTVEEEKGGKK